MIASPNHSSRNGKTVRLVVLHTAEGARTVQSLGNYFANPDTDASSHVGIDDDEIEQYVSYDRAAWTMRSANEISDQAELCGFASWSRDTWLGEHLGMLNLAAQWIRDRCRVRGIPIRKLSPAEVAAGKAGVIGHVDWTYGMRDGTHTDPGMDFPWDYVIAKAAGDLDLEDELSWDQTFTDPDTGESYSAGTWLVYANKKAEQALQAAQSALNAVNELLDTPVQSPDETNEDGSPRSYPLRDWIVWGNRFAKAAAEQTKPVEEVQQ